MHILVELLEECGKSKHVQHITKVVELGRRDNEQKRFTLLPGGHHRDCKVRLKYAKKRRYPSQKESAVTKVDRASSSESSAARRQTHGSGGGERGVLKEESDTESLRQHVERDREKKEKNSCHLEGRVGKGQLPPPPPGRSCRSSSQRELPGPPALVDVATDRPARYLRPARLKETVSFEITK